MEGPLARPVSALTARVVAGGAAGSGAHAAPTACGSALAARTVRTGRVLPCFRCWRGSAEPADERPILSWSPGGGTAPKPDKVQRATLIETGAPAPMRRGGLGRVIGMACVGLDRPSGCRRCCQQRCACRVLLRCVLPLCCYVRACASCLVPLLAGACCCVLLRAASCCCMLWLLLLFAALRSYVRSVVAVRCCFVLHAAGGGARRLAERIPQASEAFAGASSSSKQQQETMTNKRARDMH